MNKDYDFIENDEEELEESEDSGSDLESETDGDSKESVNQTIQIQDMDTLVKSMTFEQAGKPWPKSDDEKLKDLYSNQNLNVIQIADIFKRGPNGIICRLKVLDLIKEKKYARGYFDYIRYKEQFKKIKEPNKRGRKPKNQIEMILEQNKNIEKLIQNINKSNIINKPIHIPITTNNSTINQSNDLVSELLELNNSFNKKIDKLKSEFSLQMMQIISKYNKLNTTDPNCEIINIGLKKYILKNGQVYNIVTGSLYGMYDSTSNKCVKI